MREFAISAELDIDAETLWREKDLVPFREQMCRFLDLASVVDEATWIEDGRSFRYAGATWAGDVCSSCARMLTTRDACA